MIGIPISIFWSTTGYAMTVYIFYFYLIKPSGEWDYILDNLSHSLTQRIPMYIHLVGAATILIIGPIQLLQLKYKNGLHKYTGSLYALGCFTTAVAGLVYMAMNKTVGGPIMTAAFSIYGGLLIIFTLMVLGYAIAGNSRIHREWAIRLYMLASSPVLYRVCYLLLLTFRPDLHREDYEAWMDITIEWGFFILPMILTEIFIQIRKNSWTKLEKDIYHILSDSETSHVETWRDFYSSQGEIHYPYSAEWSS